MHDARDYFLLNLSLHMFVCLSDGSIICTFVLHIADAFSHIYRQKINLEKKENRWQ